MNELSNPQKKDIRSVLEGMKGQFGLALPKFLTPERFTRVALTCVNKNPKLLTCTRESLLACLMDCAMLGIEPDGRRAHLIPYGDKCTLIIDYKGIAELVRRSGEVSTLHCGVVYPGDEFDYMFGTGQFLKHKPNLQRDDPNAKPFCVYSYIKLKTGNEDFDIMSIADVDRVRKRSRSGGSGPWVTDYDEMAKKTVFRRHSKWLPLSPELRDKLEKDDEPMTEQERFAAARPVASSDVKFGDALPIEAELTSEPEPEQTPEPEAPKQRKTKPMPPRATPLEGLRNLLVSSRISEAVFLRYMIGLELLPEHVLELDELPDETLAAMIATFPAHVDEMEKEF